jgi:hypothetical protein
VAERVVNELGLDQPKDDSGGRSTRGPRARVDLRPRRAILTFGFYKEADKHEKAVGTVQAAVSAHQLGNHQRRAPPAAGVLRAGDHGQRHDARRGP